MMEKNRGWVRLWRQQFYHWISDRKPWCDGYAWTYLYSQANHKAGVWNFRNQYIPVERGELITSKLKLRQLFGWSRKRLDSFLKSLKNEKMGTYRSTNRFLMITICNYERYQKKEEGKEQTDLQPEEQTESRQRADREPQTRMIKNGENEKKNAAPEMAFFINAIPCPKCKELRPLKEIINRKYDGCEKCLPTTH
jgi:hypothetical protein